MSVIHLRVEAATTSIKTPSRKSTGLIWEWSWFKMNELWLCIRLIQLQSKTLLVSRAKTAALSRFWEIGEDENGEMLLGLLGIYTPILVLSRDILIIREFTTINSL